MTSDLLLSFVSVLLVAIQALHFFLMSDIRDRIVRLENNFMQILEKNWDGKTERRCKNYVPVE